jgi:hypothetical protein
MSIHDGGPVGNGPQDLDFEEQYLDFLAWCRDWEAGDEGECERLAALCLGWGHTILLTLEHGGKIGRKPVYGNWEASTVRGYDHRGKPIPFADLVTTFRRHLERTDPPGTVALWLSRTKFDDEGNLTELACIDVDYRNGGREGFARLERLLGPLPRTVCDDREGGPHSYFAVPNGLWGRAAPHGGHVGLELGVDFLGGYAAIPPSRGRYWVIAPDSAGEYYALLPPPWLEYAWERICDRGKAPRREALGKAPQPAPAPKVVLPGSSAAVPAFLADCVVKYLATKPPAVSGQGGRKRTWDVACKLIHGFALTPEQALPLMAAWNARCDPPWDYGELMETLRKVDRCEDAMGKRRGWLRPKGAWLPPKAPKA